MWPLTERGAVITVFKGIFLVSYTSCDCAKHRVSYCGKFELSLPVVPWLLDIVCGETLYGAHSKVEAEENTRLYVQ